MKTRLMSLFLLCCLVADMLPVTAFGATVPFDADILETEVILPESSEEWTAESEDAENDLFTDREFSEFSDSAATLMAETDEAYEALKRSMASQLLAFYAGDADQVRLTVQASSKEEALSVFTKVYGQMRWNYPEQLYFFQNMYWTYSLNSEKENEWTISFTPYGEHRDLMMDAVTFQSAVEQASMECFGSIDGNNDTMTDLEKIVAVHDWLSACCRYDPAIKYGISSDGSLSWTAPDGNVYAFLGKQGAYPALVWRNAECGGYARAFKILMDRAGIGCSIAYGSIPGTDRTHVWNVVELDGKLYYVDSTNDSILQVNTGIYDYAGRINRTKLLVSDEKIMSSEWEWTTEYDLVCPVSYTLPEALENADHIPAIYHEGYFYLVGKNGSLYQYEVGSDFSSGKELVSLGFNPGAGVCDHRTGTLYFTQVENGNAVSIWFYTPGEANAALTKFAEVSGYTRVGLYADAMQNGQTLLRAVYCYQTIQSWLMGEASDDGIAPIFASGVGTENDPFQIATAEQMRKFAEQVNAADRNYNAAHYILTADIDLGGEAWTPIGKDAEGRLTAFQGVFDGQNHIISGLYVKGGNYVGLFSSASNGEIKNLTVSGNVEGGSYVGGLCGCNSSIITNCTSNVHISASGNYVGGIVGYNYMCPLESCSNLGDVSASGVCVGGIAGENYNSRNGFGGKFSEIDFFKGRLINCKNSGNISSNYDKVGGLVGYDHAGTLTDDSNFGDISGASSYTGGLVGYCNASTLTGCSNFGSVSGNSERIGGVSGYNYRGMITNCSNSGTVQGSDSNLGGVVGRNYEGAIESCYNAGDIYGGAYTGGVVGRNSSEGGNSIVRNCYNIKAVEGTSYVGGVIGYNSNNGSVEFCYSIGRIAGNSRVGGVAGYNNTSGTVKSCFYLQTDALNTALAAVASNNGGTIESTGPLSGEKFADSNNFIGWSNEIWIVKSGLVLSAGSVTVRPVLSGNSEITAVSDSVFKINGISVTGTDGRIRNTIPKGEFFATVSVTSFVSGASPTVILASYTSNGRFQGLMYFSVRGTANASMEVTLPVNNSDGSIAQLKAFAILSFIDPIPLSESVAFPAA